MFFPFLHFIAAEMEKNYSITRPIVQTNVSEIGYWSMRGSATNMKSFIRLTSATENDYGSLCQRMPTSFDSWSLTVKLRSFGGSGGRGFWLYYSKELCPVLPTEWEGFSVWVNTSSIDKNGNSPIYFAENNGNYSIFPSNYTHIGYVPIHKESDEMAINIKKVANEISINKMKNNETTQLFRKSIPDMISTGYFTISSLTTKATDNNDLFEIIVESLSEKREVPFDILKDNKKILESYANYRRPNKKIRRSMMVTVLKYLHEVENMNKTLNGTSQLKDSMNMIRESYNRALSSISVSDLMRFIDDQINEKITSAYEMMSESFENFTQIKKDLDTVWNYLKQQIEQLSKESNSFMSVVREEVMEIVQNVTLFRSNPINAMPKLKEEASKVADSYVTEILLIIAVTEFIVYLLFFVLRRFQTNGFKKRD